MLSTPDLCDQYSEQVKVITPNAFRDYGAKDCFAGEVVTIKCFEDNSRVKEQLAEPGIGRVLVVDGGASMRRALLGDLIAANAVQNGWAGVVIFGCVRDVEILSTLPLGIKALASIPLKTDRRGAGQVNITLEVGGIQIQPGDYLVADTNGVVVVPALIGRTLAAS
ncbi:putative 4-hydroxy-4-methyl-2-oxoglutarate aldolase [Umboniibacter marinipuniceus]|uniref:4-hydroxy-4-methyl-2-oxoglutarate aldolase n=1 Tax=Umboniibacter marinipuniceus TaxID=569599 RepID=A0A3M0AEH9_9GAMM|nr:putative 4-hydroxy-4-methyl-2-oxoglutarate aldolase [Umboniibacter marinipuniceus]RMA82554.1 regulator of ribonuclease activity A [Umboniibacter marinipuniceus]